MPHRIIRPCIFAGMKPHELINALMHDEGGASALARKIGKPHLQPTIHKLAAGHVSSPRMSTAMPLAVYFKIPIEAIYDERAATKVAKDRNISALPAAILSVRKRSSSAEEKAKRVAKEYSLMSPAQRRTFERLLQEARLAPAGLQSIHTSPPDSGPVAGVDSGDAEVKESRTLTKNERHKN